MAEWNAKEVRQRVADLLLEELKESKGEAWWYISIAGPDGFVGAYLLRAHGPTDAWSKMHHLNWCPPDCSTQTHGPFDDEVMARIPEEQHWRRLTKDEAMKLGK